MVNTEHFLPKTSHKAKIFTAFIQYCTRDPHQCKKFRKRNEAFKGRKDKVTLPLQLYGMIFYVENPKESTKKKTQNNPTKLLQ